jgi:hypothetical protein
VKRRIPDIRLWFSRFITFGESIHTKVKNSQKYLFGYKRIDGPMFDSSHITVCFDVGGLWDLPDNDRSVVFP